MSGYSSNVDSLRLFVLLLGFLLVAAGGVLMLYIASMVYTVLHTPGDVPIVQFLLEKVNAGDMAFYGAMENPNDPTRPIKFEIRWAESVRTISFFLLGCAVAGILAQILAAMLGGGTKLMQYALGERKKPKDDAR